MRIGLSTKPLVQRWFILVAAVVGSGLVHHPARAEPADLQLARLAPDQETPTQLGPLPRPLGFADIVRYRQIFALQHEAAWGEADRLIDQLDDPVAARARAGRPLPASPAYRSSYVELAAWLERYADLPEAAQIYRLAIGRKPAGAKKPPAPVEAAGIGGVQAGDGAGRPGARELWRKGVAAWRAGDAENAAESFTRLADNESLDGEDLARAAFWAARADLRARRPQFVARFLRMAARSSDEFYGLLAQKTLDERIDFDWREEQLKESMLDLLIRYPAVQRAMALVHVGETELADGEVRRLADRARPELAQALVSLAATLELPSAQVELAPQAGRADGRRHDGASYPLPQWQPAGGYRLEPSLVNAVIRAESGFDADARSPKGALGLMQVMPDTARARGQAHGAGLQWRGLAACTRRTTWRWARPGCSSWPATPTVGDSLIHLSSPIMPARAGWRVAGQGSQGRSARPAVVRREPADRRDARLRQEGDGQSLGLSGRLGRAHPVAAGAGRERWPESSRARGSAPAKGKAVASAN